MPGSPSWRIPLAIQLIPGIILALGSIYLPPSPRLLVLQGRYDEALQSLARLRAVPGSQPSDVSSDTTNDRLDPVLQVRFYCPPSPSYMQPPNQDLQIELLEMKVEAALVKRLDDNTDSTAGSNGKPPTVRSEWGTWSRLFSRPYRERTLIGVMIMVFQRRPFFFRVDFAVMNAISFHLFGYSEWSGINALLYYGPILVRSVGLGSGTGKDGDAVTLMVSGGIGIVQFLAVVPVIIVIDRIGE